MIMEAHNTFIHPRLPYAQNEFRYNVYRYYLDSIFGEPVQRVSIEGGFTCPNRDGSKGYGGCIYCNNESFSPRYHREKLSIRAQLDEGIIHLDKRFAAKKYLAYFQSYSNTYAQTETLEKLYTEALDHPQVVGLAVSTRSDCLDDAVIALLKNISQNHYLNLEIGIESVYDESLIWMNRQHNLNSVLSAFDKLQGANIDLTGHIILGLPVENRTQMLAMADILNQLPIKLLKIHHLQIIEHTRLAKMYAENPFTVFQYEEYIDVLIHFISRLDHRIILQRLFTDAPLRFLVAPTWGKRSTEVIMDIRKRMKELNMWQGKSLE